MPQTVEELTSLMELEEIEFGLYRGVHPQTQLQRAFGGQVLAQALSAADRTVEDGRDVHSLHAYFMRPGRTSSPIIYDVESSRDGGSFSTRRVRARQGGSVIFTMSASFHISEPGLEHQDPVPRDLPSPQDCPRLADVMAKLSGRPASSWLQEWGALDIRYIGDSRPGGTLSDPDHPARSRVWVKVDGALPATTIWQRAALAYASDLTLLAVSTVPHPVVFGSSSLQAASLDHSMWFHRPFAADQWLLYDQISPSASGSLGLSYGRLFQNDTLVATVAQEGLIRTV